MFLLLSDCNLSSMNHKHFNHNIDINDNDNYITNENCSFVYINFKEKVDVSCYFLN